MSKKTPEIRVLAGNEAGLALDFLTRSGTAYGPDDIEKLEAGVTSGTWSFVMASVDGADVGCFYLNRAPKYHVYRALKLPELQDLRVLPGHRQQGIGRALVEFAENLAKTEGAEGLGISVGLTADYGPAQRLYVDMGYMPDGNGVTLDRHAIEKGQKIPMDDGVCLMLLKLF